MSEIFTNWLDSKRNLSPADDALEQKDVIGFLDNMKGLLFPGYVEHVNILSDYLDEKVDAIRYYLHKLLRAVERINKKALICNKMIDCFFNDIPSVDELLKTDLQAIFDGDPAAKSDSEIILTYPGFMAIFTYRIAHVLYEHQVPILPIIKKFSKKFSACIGKGSQ